MAEPDWTARQGDTKKAFPFKCQDSNGPVDISNAQAVRFHLTKAVGKPPILDELVLTIIDDGTVPLRGQGQYDWKPGETDDLIGKYYAEIEVTFSDGRPGTFPDQKGEYAILEFSEQIA